MSDFENMNDHDLLVRVANDQGWIKTMLNNHLKHHWAVTLSMIGLAAASLTSLLVTLLSK